MGGIIRGEVSPWKASKAMGGNSWVFGWRGEQGKIMYHCVAEAPGDFDSVSARWAGRVWQCQCGDCSHWTCTSYQQKMGYLGRAKTIRWVGFFPWLECVMCATCVQAYAYVDVVGCMLDLCGNVARKFWAYQQFDSTHNQRTVQGKRGHCQIWHFAS